MSTTYVLNSDVVWWWFSTESNHTTLPLIPADNRCASKWSFFTQARSVPHARYFCNASICPNVLLCITNTSCNDSYWLCSSSVDLCNIHRSLYTSHLSTMSMWIWKIHLTNLLQIPFQRAWWSIMHRRNNLRRLHQTYLLPRYKANFLRSHEADTIINLHRYFN